MLRERGKIPLKSHSTGTFPSFLECQCEDLRLKSSGEHPPFPALSPGPLSSCNTAPYRQDLSLPITTAAVGEDFITRVFQINSFGAASEGSHLLQSHEIFPGPCLHKLWAQLLLSLSEPLLADQN